MLLPAKILLGPILLAQGKRVRRTALRLPEAAGPRAGEVPAAQGVPLRLLFVGDSSAAGVGVTHQAQAWAQPAAAEVALQLGRPVHWQLVAKSSINTHDALGLLQSASPAPADVLITALGVNDVTAQTSPAQLIAQTRALHEAARARCGATQVVRIGIPPMGRFTALPQPLRWYLGQCASRLDAAVRDALHDPATLRFIHPDDPALMAVGELAADGYHPGPAQYRAMAAVTAREVVALVAR